MPYVSRHPHTPGAIYLLLLSSPVHSGGNDPFCSLAYMLTASPIWCRVAPQLTICEYSPGFFRAGRSRLIKSTTIPLTPNRSPHVKPPPRGVCGSKFGLGEGAL